jgi:hypothetical protein
MALCWTSIHNAADADQPGIRIAVPRGDGSDLELTRVLKRAELVRTDTIDAALELVRVGSAHGRAGPRPVLLAEQSSCPALAFSMTALPSSTAPHGYPRARPVDFTALHRGSSPH